MSSQVQYRRGTNAQNIAFTGALAEITVDTTNGTLRVHDAITAGGSNIATVAYVTSQISALSANSITSGTSNLSIIASGGNIRGNVGGATVTNIYSGGIELTGLLSASGTATAGNIATGGTVSATGNITGGNLIISGAIQDSAQLDIRTTAGNANIVLTPNGTGNVNFGSNIMPTANATANIGSATSSFNTVFAKATSAQYADLAEWYEADADYPPGTVLIFGGDREVTQAVGINDVRVAGVVSTNPAHIMNSGLKAPHIAAVALTGRVPTLIVGTVKKGDMMVTAGGGRAQACAEPKMGSVIGKALQDHTGGQGTIEIVVGRL